MAFWDWLDEYSVGVGAMDDEHKKLVGYINELHEAMKAGRSLAALGPLLTSLNSYAQTHFGNEERLMQRYGYPGLPEQQQAHKRFIEQVHAFEEELAAGRTPIIKIMSFLKDWLSSHIMSLDKQYTDFFKEKGIT